MKSEKSIKQFWDENPVGTNFVNFETGKEYFEAYDSFRYRTEGHILKELNSIDFKGKKVLEIGLGQGADSMQIAKRGALYNGIDLTPESVRRVKQRFEIFDLPFQSILEASAINIPFASETFDIVYSHGVIHHSPQIEQIVDEIFRVLKPGGKAVIMLYHKNSFNYHFSVKFIRRIGLVFIRLFPFLTGLVSKLTGEGKERIKKHITNFKKEGWGYLSMENFIHRSTDGPDNVFSTVWTKETSRKLFGMFENHEFSVHFFNKRHLLGLQYLLPTSYLEKMGNKYGWHLWIKSTKPEDSQSPSRSNEEDGVLHRDIDLKKNLGCG